MDITRFCALCAALTFAAAARADAIDDRMRQEMATRRVPGAALALLKDGKLVKIAGYGQANVETGAPVTPDTVFQLASVTKQFTAAGILMLVEEGKIGIDDPIRTHLPDLPDTWQPVTVRHLLNHTSGIFSYTALPNFMSEAHRRYTPAELVARVADRPLNFAPGSRWDYSNTGYVVLGMLLEKASGMPWDRFLQTRIFAPLGMTHTRTNDLEEVIPGRAAGYGVSPRGRVNVPAVHPSQPMAAGALVSTVRDMARWLAAVDAGKLLKKESWALAFAPVRLTDGKTAEYGMGWQVDQVNGRTRIAHGGGIPGFSTWDMRVPSERVSLAILTNTDAADAGAIGKQIAAQAAPALTPLPPKPIADPEPTVSAGVRTMVEALLKGEVDRSRLTPEFSAQLTPERVREGKDALGGFGALKSFTLVTREEKDGGRNLGYLAVIGTTTVRVGVRIAPDGKVAGLGFRPE